MIKINHLTNITRKGQDNDRKLLNIPNNDTQITSYADHNYKLKSLNT